MLWSEFNTKVFERLGPEGVRAGTELVVAAWIKAALIDLQDKVPSLTKGHETIYTHSDVIEDGFASRGVLPTAMLLFDSAYLIEPNEDVADDVENKWPAVKNDWDRREEFIHGTAGYPDLATIMFDRQGVTFYLWPSLTPEKTCILSLRWDGKKTSWLDDEEVAFDDAVADAVSDYVMAHARRFVEQDLNGYQSFMSSYSAKRRDLYSSHHRRFA